MVLDNATNFYRKFGVAERRDLRFYGPFMKRAFRRSGGTCVAPIPSSERSGTGATAHLSRIITTVINTRSKQENHAQIKDPQGRGQAL